MACRPVQTVAPAILRIAVVGALDIVGPDISSQRWTVLANQMVFEPLVDLGPAGEIVPVLAARAELVSARSLRVWLRSGATFSDGAPVTFDDVARSLAVSQLRVTPQAGGALIESENLAVPVELLGSRASIFRTESSGLKLGTGAFLVAEQDTNHIALQRRQPAPGRLDSISLVAYRTPQEAFAHTLKGDAEMLPDVDPHWLEFFEGVPRLRVLRAPGTHANIVAFDLARVSRQERVALARLLSSDQLRQLAFGNDCAPPADGPGIEPAVAPTGRPLDVLAVPIFERFALAVRRVLGARGGAVRLEGLKEYFEAIRARDFDLATARPVVWPPIMSVLSWRTGAPTNVLGYSNPLVDKALDAHDWGAARRALDEDPPAAFICNPSSVVVLDARIKNASLNTTRFTQGMAQWEVQQ